MTPVHLTTRLPKFWMTLVWFVVFAAVVILRVWQDTTAYNLGGPQQRCGTGELEHNDRVETWVYQHVLPRVRAQGPSYVALLTLSPSAVPGDFFNNVCDSRRLFTYLLPRIAAMQPRVVAIDKFYSDQACSNDGINEEFRQAMNRVAQTVPVVVGEAAEDPDDSSQKPDDDCLTLLPAFSFNSSVTGEVSRVHLGLTRLNTNTLQIPLGWIVRQTEGKVSSLKSSFALTAAEQADASLITDPYIHRYASEQTQKHHPFGEFPKTLPTWSVMDVLCSGSDDVVRAKHLGSCLGRPKSTVDIQGKVVVIGEHVSGDMQPFPGGSRYGMDLQGTYINALIARQFFKQMPLPLDWAEVVLVVAIPILFDFFGNRVPGLRKRLEAYSTSRRVFITLVYTVLCWLVLLLIDSFLLAFGHIYPPIFILSIGPIAGGLLSSFVPALLTDVKDAHYPRQETA